MLVHWLYLKVNSAEREHAPNDVVGKVTVQSLRVSSEDRRTTVREQTVKQCTELLDFFATRQLNGVERQLYRAHSSHSPSCPAADGVFSLIAPHWHVGTSSPHTDVDAHTSRLYVGSNSWGLRAVGPRTTSSNKQCAFRQLWKKYGGVFIVRETHVH